MKLTTAEKLEIYERVLKQYIATNDPKTATQRRLIARLKQEQADDVAGIRKGRQRARGH
ncbi:MAG: hypothetical protein AAFR73_12290 [Pseudomonadota bacterium]